jgi:hypothetical protein
VGFAVVRSGSNNEEDEQGGTPDPEIIPPADRFLKLNAEGLWKLGPLPDIGSVLRKDLADAMHSYITQKWSECSGSIKITL